MQVEVVQQRMESLQQQVISSQTAHHQVSGQLKEALNDKAMLERQMEATLSLTGRAGAMLGLAALASCQMSMLCHAQREAVLSFRWT